MPSQEPLAKATQKYEDAYIKRTPKSQAAIQAARQYMPGGETRSSAHFLPHPLWIDKASGFTLTDLDGNEYIDFNNNHTSLALAHSHPKIVEALSKQMVKGTAYAAYTPLIIRWSELICRRAESIQKVKFCNSGTEAGMLAVRLARAFTGKDKILKIEGGYSGSYDAVVTTKASAEGITKNVLSDTILIPYNDKEAAETAINKNKGQLAAMIVEGMIGGAGFIPAQESYLNFLRELTAASNVLLIMDEVITFRLDYGGMQHVYGVTPDLTMLGKIIGGGLPVGAVGGREDIMNLSSVEVKRIINSGTFNGNPMTAAAGVTTLEHLTSEEIARINKLGESLAQGIRKIFAKQDIQAQVTGYGSLQYPHFTTIPVVNPGIAQQANQGIRHLLHLALMERGIYASSRCMFVISTPMTDEQISICLKAFEDALTELKPRIEQIWPELIGAPVSG